ncbi:MAG TPA: hypothetical protein VHX38_23930 [Pseudonocardiaceae bacterium]|nr:hypothetical protein [Pseudonocardiaceae bacterium]
MTDILDLIDQATSEPAARCWHCREPVGGSVSDDFCTQECQTAWHANRSEPLTSYREPVDLPAHYSHEPELHDIAPPLFTSNRVVIPSSTQAFGVGQWSTRAGTVYDIPTRGRCLVTGPREASWDDTIHGAERVNEYLARDPAGNQIIVTREFLEQACTEVPLDALLVGGRRHGETGSIGTQAPNYLNFPEPVSGNAFTTVAYRRSHCDGEHWYYVLDTPDRRDRTVPATERCPELIVRHRHYDPLPDQWVVTVEGGDFTMAGELPGALLADDTALRSWFLGRRSAALAHAEAQAYELAEQREPGLLQRRRDALRPRLGEVVDHLPHEGLYVHEYAGTDERSWFTPEQVRALFERPTQPVVARERVVPIGPPYQPGQPWLPSQITPHRRDRSLIDGDWTPTAPSEPLLILAGNLTQARNIAEIDLGLNRRQWTYIRETRQLLGRHGGQYYVPPTFWSRRDADELYAMLATRRMTPVSLAELDALRAASQSGC